MICSFLIPSRERFDRLLSCVDSIHRTAGHENIEILVRLDGDDVQSCSRIRELQIRGVIVIVGDRLDGYASLHEFYNELAERAKGRWVFFLNDDITLETTHPNWMDQLKELPDWGTLACSGHYRLGGSLYHTPGLACPIVPNKCWLRLGWPAIAGCVDEAFKKLLVVDNGWSVIPLPSLTVNHQRDSDAQLRLHRIGKPMKATICLITSRYKPCAEWLFDSLAKQTESGDELQLIVVDAHKAGRDTSKWPKDVLHVEPKPNVWQGKHRVTSCDWWIASAARNTGLCYAKHDYIVWVDDRSVLMPGWLDAIRLAKLSNYAVCGNYEKRTGMVVENGVIVHGGIVTGKDGRDTGRNVVQNCFGQFWGGTYGCPLEWALTLNGFEELVDGLGAEDYIFGNMLLNNGFESKWNPKLKIIQDRTPGEIGPDMRKTDKGISPKDKSHAALDRFGNLKRCQHPWDFREIRKSVLLGGVFPNTDDFPRHDWFDGEPIALMK